MKREVLRKSKEAAKTALLIALILSTILLSGKLWVYDRLYDGNAAAIQTIQSVLSAFGLDFLAERLDAPGSQSEVTDTPERYLYPSSVSLLGETLRSTAYSTDSTVQVYPVIRELIGTLIAGQPAQIDTPFEELLEGEGVLVDFGRWMSFDTLAALSGGERPVRDGLGARHLLLRPEQDGLRLLAQDDRTGAVWEFTGGVEQLESFEQNLLRLSDSGLFLPATLYTGGQGRLGAYVFPNAQGSLPGRILIENPIFDGELNAAASKDVLKVFGYNAGTLRRDTDPDGTTIYVENYSSLRISPEGELRYRASQITKGIPVSRYVGKQDISEYSYDEVLLAAYRFVDSFQSGIVGGDGADLRFTESWFDAQDNSLVLCFDYVSEGISLELVSGGVSQSAVTLRYQNGYFTSAQMLFRSFTQTDAGKSELLPDKADELLGLAAGGLPAGYTLEADYRFDRQSVSAEFAYFARLAERSEQ